MCEAKDLVYRPCVGLVVLNEQKRIFTGQRFDYSSAAWQMPQGGIEVGEDPLIAAYRELYEETSISKRDLEVLAVSQHWLTYDLPEDLIPKLWGGKYKGQRQRWFLMKFIGDDTNIDLSTDIPEFARWRWATKIQVINSIVPFKKELYKSVLEEFHSFL